MNYWGLAMIKWVLFALAAILGTVLAQNGPEYYVKQYYAKSGHSLIYVLNAEQHQIYCWIRSANYFVDFYVGPRGKSRAYYEPGENYEVVCLS